MKERCCSSSERRLVQNQEQKMLFDDSVNAVELRCLLTKDVFTERVTVEDYEKSTDWQCGTIQQELADEPWKRQTLFKKERRSFRHSRLRRRAQRHRPTKPPLHADDFHPKVPLDLSLERCGLIVNFLMQVAGCQFRRAPQISTGSRTMSQASAPSPSWDATEGSIGRADRTAWQVLLEMQR